MLRTTIATCAAALSLALSAPVWADELPIRKPGFWVMKHSMGNDAQECTDATVDRKMLEPLTVGLLNCAKHETLKTANGYMSTLEGCDLMDGRIVTMKNEFIGDFNSAYIVKQSISTSSKTVELEFKWVGDCKPGLKPGDFTTETGTYNVND